MESAHSTRVRPVVQGRQDRRITVPVGRYFIAVRGLMESRTVRIARFAVHPDAASGQRECRRRRYTHAGTYGVQWTGNLEEDMHKTHDLGHPLMPGLSNIQAQISTPVYA